MRKRWISRLSFLTLALFLMAALAACNPGQAPEQEQGGGEQEKPFHIGVIPSQNQGDMQKAMNKLAQILEHKLGRDVEIKVYSDYNGVVEAMSYGHIDMAFFGPLTYVIAHEKSGAEAIITQLVDGKPYYYSYLIAHKDSPWNSLDDVVKHSKEIRLAFGDVNSTSGSLIPGLVLKKKGVFVDQNNHQFKSVVYTGNHDATALAVQNKQADVGAIDSAIFNVLNKEGKIDANAFKVIWKSEPLFQYPWAVKKGTSPKLIKQLQDAFVGIKDPEILNAFGASGFTTCSDKDYEAIRKAAKEAGRL
ncbi:MAG TPA: phosphate/phosphite/phosphonate ABC transporter substrate-binding protein [Calditerricola sp.]